MRHQICSLYNNYACMHAWSKVAVVKFMHAWLLYIASSLLARSVYNGQGPDHYHYIQGPITSLWYTSHCHVMTIYLADNQNTLFNTLFIYIAMHS